MNRPGIYKIPNEVYHHHPDYAALSSSMFTELDKSPMHLKHRIDNPDDPTPAMVTGTLFGWIVTEPHKFDERVGVWSGRKAGNAYKEFAKDYDHILKPDELDQLTDMRDSLLSNPYAQGLLQNGITEESFFWKDPAHEIMCKCRTDYRRPDLKIAVDLKTAVDASPDGFAKALINYGYVRQAPWYLNGLYEVTGEKYDFVFLVVEKKPPYAVGIYHMDQAALDYGRSQIRPLLDLYAECLKNDNWPGYTQGIEEVTLPPWAK